MKKILNYIDGELIEPCSAEYIDNFEPAKAEVYSLIPDSDFKDVELAVTAAKKAFPGWSSVSSEERSQVLYRISELILENLDFLAEAESRDNGKPLSLAKKVDIPRAAQNFKFFATAILHHSSKSHEMGGLAINYTRKKAVGVAGCISPWNLPLYLFSWKIAPALAVGNCVVAKPSEVTPMTAFLLSEICIEAGLPKGVLNIVHGYGHKVGSAITEHPSIPIISFTGGTKTGEQIARTAAPMFKKLSLELGGKNPNIIFADCDFDEMIKTTLLSSFSNQGQICLCGSRIFVERAIYEKFKKAFVEKTKGLKVGVPYDSESKVGALVSKAHMEKVLSYIELAKEEGGKILAGGNQLQMEGEYRNGWYVEPTIIESLSYNCRTNKEEIFGPVVSIMPFDEEEEVLKMANSTQYGLSATVWTGDVRRATKFSSELHVGIVWVNCWLIRDLRTPFGGMKNSGVGREGGFQVLDFFTEQQNICIRY